MSTTPSRWTQATVYPDMWVDPDDDPRNTDGTSPDGESATQLEYIRDYRTTLRMKCAGLEAEQLSRRSVPPSTMSHLGLLRHMAEVELDWCNWITQDEPRQCLYGGLDAAFDVVGSDVGMVDASLADLEREQAITDSEVAKHEDLGTRLGDSQIAVRECIDGRTGQ